MTKALAIAVIHGMGSQQPDAQDDAHYADAMIREINGRIVDLHKDPGRIAWKQIYWANILEARQNHYLHKATSQGDLDWLDLRRFVVTALGDVSAYQRIGLESSRDTATAVSGTYARIHGRVRNCIKQLHELVDGSDPPLIVIAHSLGGHIMSNYIWDLQTGNATAGPSDFQQMKTLAGFVTFGCNIPLFTFAYDAEQIKPIVFPGSRLPDPVKAKAKWLNFYDPDDVLGYPLRPINAAYEVLVDDRPINAGQLWESWNPLSHTTYWTDNSFTKPVSHFIASFL